MPLFHFLAESYSIVVVILIFIVAWNSRRYADNQFFVFLGISYLFVSGIDFFHAFSYSGMNIFHGFDANLPTQLWIAARYLQALSFFAAFALLPKKISVWKIFAVYWVIFIAVLMAIFSSHFPAAYLAGSGLTAFKIASEYIISFILFVSIVIGIKKQAYFRKNVLILIIASMAFTVISELVFTLYWDPYGVYNVLGHFFKVISSLLVYESIVVTGLREPQDIIFNKLKESEEGYKKGEQRFRGTLDNMLEGCQIIGFDWRYLYVNDTAALHGRTAKDKLLGRTMMEVYPGIEETKLFAELRKCMKEKRAAVMENEFIYPDGEHGWFKLSIQPSEDGLLILSVDITEQKRAEETIRNLALFPEQNPYPVLRVKTDGTVLFANNASKPLLESWNCRQGDPVPDSIRSRIARAIKNGQLFSFDEDCGSVSYSLSITPFGSFGYANLYGLDITERKRAERLIRESQEDLNRAQAVSHVGSWRLDARKNELSWSDEIRRIYGIPEGKILTHETFMASVHPEDKEYENRKWREAIAGGDPYDLEFRIIVGDNVRWVSGKSQLDFGPDGEFLGGFGTIQDITERKNAERLIRESQEDLNRAQAVSHIGSWRLDTKKNELIWSEENYRIFGVPSGESMTYETFLASVHPADRKYVDEKWKAALAGAPYDIEHRIVAGDEIKWVREKAGLEFDSEGGLLGGFGTTQDITERKRIQEALRQSEEKYKALAETSPDCIKLFDPEGKLLYINKAGLEEHGLKSIEEAMDWDYFGCMVEKDRGKFRKTFENALGGETNTIEIEHTPEGANRDVCLETMTPVRNKKGEVGAVYGVSRDISDLKKFDRAKSEFVSMASHQLRTPLTSSGFALELLLRDSGKIDEEQRDYLESAHKDISFMTELVNRLLNISRIEMGTFTDNPKIIELQPFLKEVVGNLVILAAKKDQRIIAEYADDIPGTMTVDPNIFRNILSNLISNAIKYTPEKGKITVSATAKDSGVVIGITDTGPGIPVEIQPKVFTKLYKAHEMLRTEGESSGLGLYIAKLFTEALGGRIWFESEANKRTTFYVYLPQSAKKQ
ncbi:MAG: MASE3 domain-containing protein [Candidatus Falkowbacteria bacterium]